MAIQIIQLVEDQILVNGKVVSFDEKTGKMGEEHVHLEENERKAAQNYIKSVVPRKLKLQSSLVTV